MVRGGAGNQVLFSTCRQIEHRTEVRIVHPEREYTAICSAGISPFL